MKLKPAVRVARRISEIGREAWDACALNPAYAGNPFIRYDFLHAAEETDCATERTGWGPQHLAVEDEAGQVAAAIFDWRTPGQRASPGGAKAAEYRAAGRDVVPTGRPFESLDELGAVLGMTPALLAALRPSLSIYNEAGLDVRYAPPAVVLALADIGMEFDPPTEARQAVTIVATAGLAEGARFRRQAVVRILGIADEHPWQILAWERADG